MNTELESLKKDILQCERCALSLTRHNVIYGEGNPHAGIFVIGEAPGRDEDMIGRPFIGKSGQMLDRIMDACGFNRREHVFISNIVRCRPPGNRVPTPQEAALCMPWLLKQIELVNPAILILLGATALRYMDGNDMKITLERGNWRTIQGRPAMPVYHPAALLRDPTLKRDTWEDFKKIVFRYRELVNPAHYSKNV